MPMKLYEVELKRIAFRTYRVEALDEGDAEDEAWKLLEKDVPQSELKMWDFNSTDPCDP